MVGIRDRVVAVLLVALLVASCFMTFSIGSASADFQNKNIKVTVVDSSSVLAINTASVTLTEVHTGAVLHPILQGTGGDYLAFEAQAGYYRIDVSAVGYYTSHGVFGISHDGLKNNSITVPLVLLANLQHTITVKVNDTLGFPIQGATVSFYDPASDQYINGVQTSGTTNSTGIAVVKIYNGIAVDLVVSMLTYEMSVTQYPAGILASGSVSIVLSKSVVVHGDFLNSIGNDATNIIGYLYNKNPAVPLEKRVIRSSTGDSKARFDAFAGNWVLVIDGKDTDPYVNTSVVVAASNIDVSRTLKAQNQSSERIWVNMTSWNALTVHVNGVWKADNSYFGLDYADMGSLRAQVDIALGDGDGLVDGTEWSDFTNNVISVQGPIYVSTSNLFLVNDGGVTTNQTPYKSSIINPIAVSSVSGSVALATDIAYSNEVSYTAYKTLPASASSYYGIFTVPYDSASMNRSFLIDLPNNYELSHNQTVTSKVVVSGYTVVSVNPLISTVAGSESISLSFGASEDPVAKAQIIIADNTYARRNATGVLLGYVVRNGTNVTFSASGSADVNNSNPLTYNWNFGDGNTASTKYVLAWHNYTVAKNWWNATLTVVDVTGRTNVSKLNVSVDNKNPRPVIVVKNSTDATLSGTITVDQGTVLKLTPTGTLDDMVAVGDKLGTVKQYDWWVGSDAMVRRLATGTDLNLSYTFSTAGAIKVVLNVTDVVGNYKNATITVNVRDKTAPVVVMSDVWNATYGTSLLERSYVHFNASGTTDNIDNMSLLNFTWKFGDNSAVKSGIGLSNVTHNYSSYGTYTLTLNVTDLSNNTGTFTEEIYIGAGPRPNIAPSKIAFDPSIFEEGLSGKITVNITNDGSATAKNINIELWSYSGSVAQKRIGNITTFYYANGTPVTSLKVGEVGYGVFYWTPDAQGNYSIRAIGNSTDQKQSNWISNSINVNEASWKKTALYVGILVVVIVIPLLLIARRRIGSTGAMLRRPKKEKEPKEKKEKEEK
jgi:PKD domain